MNRIKSSKCIYKVSERTIYSNLEYNLVHETKVSQKYKIWINEEEFRRLKTTNNQKMMRFYFFIPGQTFKHF